MAKNTGSTQTSYDRVAADYASRFLNELEHKPFDRQMLAWLAERTLQLSEFGLLCDLGCGPGQVAHYLAGQGVQACGIDLSPQMVAQAQQAHPHLCFQQGDMLALTDVADGAFTGIAAFYSIIHIPPPQVPQALREMHRVLCDGGVLLLTFHIGQEVRHLDEWWEHPVDLDFHFFTTQQMRSDLEAAGFTIAEAIERDPYPDIEVQTRRAYIFATKPAG